MHAFNDYSVLFASIFINVIQRTCLSCCSITRKHSRSLPLEIQTQAKHRLPTNPTPHPRKLQRNRNSNPRKLQQQILARTKNLQGTTQKVQPSLFRIPVPSPQLPKSHQANPRRKHLRSPFPFPNPQASLRRVR